MSAIDNVSNYFYSDIYKRNAKFFLEILLPEDGLILDSGFVKGEVKSSSDGGFWSVKPQCWWRIKCNNTGYTYEIHFITQDTMFGDVTYLICGNKYLPILGQKNDESLREYIYSLMEDGTIDNLII